MTSESRLFSREIELSALGAIVMDYEWALPAISELSADDFYFSDCKELFQAIQSVYSAEGYLDIPLISPKVKNLDCLLEATSSVYTSVGYEKYIAKLKELSAQRRIRAQMQNLIAGETINVSNLQELVNNEHSNIYLYSVEDRAKKALDAFINDVGKPKERIMTGFKTIDKITGGLRVPSVLMLGANASAGKTAFSLNIFERQTEPSIFFSLEMSSEMIYERLVSSNKRLDYKLFSRQEFTSEQKAEILEAAEELKNKKLHIFDDVYDVESQARIIIKIKPKLVVVDYIQKVKTAYRADGRRNEIDYISGFYKQIANRNKCVIMLLSQISRIERREPTMAALKESGALEADGDYVAILHRPYVIDKNNPEVTPEQAYFLLDKNKFGPTGKLEMHFKGEYQRFYEADDIPVSESELPAQWRRNYGR